MDFFAEFPRLEPAKQHRFREVVTRLLSGYVLTPGPALRPDADWRFADSYEALLDAYLRIGGWRLELDRGLRVCRAVHELGRQRVQFNKLESLILCLVRLVYHESMQQAGEEEVCELTVAELRERLIQAGRPASQLSRTALARAILRLARHELLGVERGFSGVDDESIVVNAVIEKVLPQGRIAELHDRVRDYLGRREPDSLDDDADAGPSGSAGAADAVEPQSTGPSETGSKEAEKHDAAGGEERAS